MNTFLKRGAGDCKWDIVGLGVLVQRMSSGVVPTHCAYDWKASLSGAEYNPVNAIAQWGGRAAYCTASVRYPRGEWLEAEVRKGGVAGIYRHFDHDPVKGPSIGTVWTDTGWGVRGPSTFYDRTNEAASLLAPGDFDLDAVFGSAAWAHFGGLFCSLGRQTAQLTLDAVLSAKKAGTMTSLDLNWREMLWAALADRAAHVATMRQIVGELDVAIGNEEDWYQTFGIPGPNVAGGEQLDPKEYEGVLRRVQSEFPNLRVIATTLRRVVDANRHVWQAVMLCDGKFYASPRKEIGVLDRVGGGDGCNAGLIYALMQGLDPQQALNCGWAHGALVVTYPTDTTMASWDQVLAVAVGKGARIIR